MITGSASETSPEGVQLHAAHLAAVVEASKILNSTLDLDRLLELILEVATRELDADRGTVYLAYAEEGEIRAKISQGLESKVLRVKIGEGISGKVAETGEPIRIEDAYNDPRFQQKFDHTSGYRTRSILCVPIRNKTGDIIGVIQLLNKKRGTFLVEDEAFLQALTVHIAIALENAKLHARLMDQERISTELALARQIQQNLLPKPVETWGHYRLAAASEPCYEVGGDFYEFLEVSPTCLAVVIADVSGKGVSSALVVSTTQATLRALALGNPTFERMLERVNSMIRTYTNGRMFVTLFMAIIHTDTRTVHYINAGHNPPVLVRTDGSHEELSEGGLVLGLLPTVSYKRAQVEIRPGDKLLLYTDGIAEAFDTDSEMFGIERTVEAVRNTAPGCPPADVLQRVFDDVKKFSEGAPKADDQTMIVIMPDEGRG